MPVDMHWKDMLLHALAAERIAQNLLGPMRTVDMQSDQHEAGTFILTYMNDPQQASQRPRAPGALRGWLQGGRRGTAEVASEQGSGG